MKRVIALVLYILVSALLFGCSAKVWTNNTSDSQAVNSSNSEAIAEQVVKDHFKFRNEKNWESLSKTMTKEQAGAKWNFDNIDSIKIISISEDTSNKVKDGYLQHGRGSIRKPVEVKVYNVKYEIKYKDDKLAADNSGTFERQYTVIKQQKDSSGLIDDWGL